MHRGFQKKIDSMHIDVVCEKDEAWLECPDVVFKDLQQSF